jgi:hypothetical protein
MLIIPQNVSDIERYYRNTYVKFSGFGDRLFFIQQVNEQEITGINDDDGEFVLFVNKTDPFSLDYVLPSKAIFQVDKEVCLLERIPARQYKRGLCNDNTQITRIGHKGGRINLSFDVLKKYTQKQEYFTLKQAIFDKGKLNAYALNSRMSFVKAADELYVDQKAIGTWSGGSLNILPQFKEEVSLLIARDPFQVTLNV